ncbi:MAG: copper homeostasis protein CutC [Bifidobacteriaceae bacterium]|jgi:copper homeostasis protein|nr:copper homeostasis protein CutC [Bifidobacteriaceae bacterium]
MVHVEVAVQDSEGARVARVCGADRVELCQSLDCGGLTPSAGLIAATVGEAQTWPLIRPRPGGFQYSDREVGVMADDVRRALDAGAAGVVVGALTGDLRVDRSACARLASAAAEFGAAPVTFHRAFDVVADRLTALAELVELGFVRVLTSGGAATARLGIAELSRLALAAAGRIEILAGGGVTAADVPALIEAGVDGVHLSARAFGAGWAGPVGCGSRIEFPGDPADRFDVTDAGLVAAAVAAARR